MPPKKIPGKAVWAVSAAVIIVVILLIAVFLMQAPANKNESITLPATQETPAVNQAEQGKEEISEEENDFFEVSNENVLMALQSLARPTSYHQVYDLTVGSDYVKSTRTVELWNNGNLTHAEVISDSETRCLITDGTTGYLWYKGSDDVITLTLDEHNSAADLLGLPDFDAHLKIQPETVVDSGYLVLEETQVQCIYVFSSEEDGITTRHWVNLENGLLYLSDVLEESAQVYTLRQTLYEALAQEDESFTDCFVLPDGSRPFTVETKTLQP